MKHKKIASQYTESKYLNLPGSLWERQSNIIRNLLIFIFLFLLIVIIYRDFIFFNKEISIPDFQSQAVVFNKFAKDYSASHHEYPLWYPYIFSGMPFQASGTYHIQYTLMNIIEYLLPNVIFENLHGSYTILLLLAAIFMFLLMRSYRVGMFGCFVSSIAFIFTSHVIGTQHLNRLNCFMYIPLIFFSLKRLFEERNFFYTVLLGAAIGFQLSSYHPQVAHYTLMMVGLYFIYSVIFDLKEKKEGRVIFKKGGLLVGSLMIALCLAAVMVLPMKEYTPYSIRGLSRGSGATAQYATSWSFHPQEILTFIIPSFVGLGGHTYWGTMPFTDFPNYLGITVILLVIFTLVFYRNKTTYFFVTVSLFALLVSFGRHFPLFSKFMLNFVPYFNKFRAPVMILILLQFSFAVLAGFGANFIHTFHDRYSKKEARLTRDKIKRILLISIIILLLIGVVVSIGKSSFYTMMDNVYDRADKTNYRYLQVSPQIKDRIDWQRFRMLFGDIWKMIVLFSAAAGLVILQLTKRIDKNLFATGIVLLVILDLFWVDLKLVNPQYKRGYIDDYYRRRENDVVKFLKQDKEKFRILPIEDISTNEYGYYGISSIAGYHAAKLGIYQEIMNEVGFNNFNLLDMLNTKYLVSRRKIEHPRFKLVFDSADGKVYQNLGYLPRIFLVDRLKVVSEKERIFNEMKSTHFNPREYAILEEKPDFKLKGKKGSTVKIIDYDARKIILKARAKQSCLLVLSEIYYPAGWKAYIDGEKTKIFKTNYILRSVYLPSGEHRIKFVFDPWTFKVGLWVSRITFLFLIAVFAFEIRKRFKKTDRRG